MLILIYSNVFSHIIFIVLILRFLSTSEFEIYSFFSVWHAIFVLNIHLYIKRRKNASVDKY